METPTRIDPYFEDCRVRGFSKIFQENVGIISSNTSNGVSYIGGEYDMIVHLLPEDIGAYTGFNVGDTVIHRDTNKKYEVCALPCCDSCELLVTENYDIELFNHLMVHGNCLWVKDENGHMSPHASGEDYLSEEECYYKNFEKM